MPSMEVEIYVGGKALMVREQSKSLHCLCLGGHGQLIQCNDYLKQFRDFLYIQSRISKRSKSMGQLNVSINNIGLECKNEHMA
ncbi:unnamed protein product [Strongylus vulgaris]|uniref:Uncharacterized protein n=1 Tax=Strongylus vulgaris TaxID=40348 RepID=A0A3P7K816_STRVU|nr:unnamed protein product [Strongylus vulgaris]